MSTPLDVTDLPYARLLTPYDGTPESESYLETALVDGAAWDDVDARDARFSECAFRSVTFTGGEFRRCGFTDVWLGGCRVVGTGLAETRWLDATAASSVLAGVEAFGAELRRVVFHGGKLTSVNLRGANLREVVFENCVLEDVDLTDATLTDVRFPGSALRGTRVARATLKDVDLRGATTVEVADDYGALRGAIIDSAQLVGLAPLLAHALGIVVRD